MIQLSLTLADSLVGPLAQPSVIHSWPGQQGTAEPQNPGDGSYVEEEKN
jgi:hypothetical protein